MSPRALTICLLTFALFSGPEAIAAENNQSKQHLATLDSPESVQAFDQVNDDALRAFLKQHLSTDSQSDQGFDRYDAEVWIERTLSIMKRFKLEQEEALQILRLVYRESRSAGLPPDLVLAVIEIESHFNRYAVSRVGAQGLMQVMPFWKNEIGRNEDSLVDTETNIRYGCYILAYYLKIANQDWAEALARYNGSYGRTVYSEKVLLAWGKRWRAAAIDW